MRFHQSLFRFNRWYPVFDSTSQSPNAATFQTLWNSTRYAILGVALFALMFAYGNSLIFTFTVICMTKPNILNGTIGNPQVVEMFSPNEKGLLYSAIAIGAIFGSLSIVSLVQRFGARRTFTCYGMLTATCTLLSPMTANYSFSAFFLIRIFQGFGTSITFASVGYISSAWFPLASTGFLLSLLTVYVQLAPLFTMPTSAFFCVSSIGWPGVYYLHGFLTILGFIMFYLFYRDTPREHRYVSDLELTEIEKSKSVINFNKIPYYEMITDKVIIGILLLAFGNCLGYQVFQQFAPVYLNKVIGLSVESTGTMSALPYILTIGLKFITGPISDKLFHSQLQSVQFFTLVPHVIMSTCLILMAKISDSFLAEILYTIYMLAGAFDSISFYKATQFVAGSFASIVMTWFSLLNSLMILVLPIAVTAIANHNEVSEWAIIFNVVSGVIVITTIIYLYTSDVKPRPWTFA